MFVKQFRKGLLNSLALILATFASMSFAVAKDQLIVTPQDGHQPFIDAIDGAKSNIKMVMFHLSDPAIATALKRAATRGVKVQLILDQATAARSTTAQTIMSDIQGAGVDVEMSSRGFSITHEKSMLIDHASLFITSINLVTTVNQTRDFGIITDNAPAIAEYETFFKADLKNAKFNTADTPTNNTRLVWSPTTSAESLTSLVASAKATIDLEVENLGSDEMTAALTKAAGAGIKVRVVVPACVMGREPNRNETYLDQLLQGGVAVKAMVGPATNARPYIHAKMIVVDGEKFYVGSENFSFNSLFKAREVGILTTNKTLASDIETVFNSDYALAQSRRIGQSQSCGASTLF